MLSVLLLSSLTATSPDAASVESNAAGEASQFELAAGSSGLLYVSAYSAASSVALEVSAAGPIRGAWRWGAGARLGLVPALPEGFVRIGAAPAHGAWLPSAALELGVTSRAHFDDGDGVLGELREASQRDILPIYVAIQAAPFSFRLLERFRLSVLELGLGTHLDPPGEFVRLQLGFASLAVELQ